MTIASIRASVDQDRKQLPANTRVKMVLMHIDRMFDSVTVGGPFTKRHSESISDDLACMVGDEMRQVAFQHRFAPALNIIMSGRLGRVIAEAMLNVIGVDRYHGSDVLFRRGPHGDCEGLLKHVVRSG